MILCTFEDGTTELRPADSVATAAGGVTRLHLVRGFVCVEIPRGDGWAPCHVETSDEQIARLTRERDEAIAQRDAARRLVKLHRIPLTAEEHVEQRALVDRAKREGWL